MSQELNAMAQRLEAARKTKEAVLKEAKERAAIPPVPIVDGVAQLPDGMTLEDGIEQIKRQLDKIDREYSAAGKALWLKLQAENEEMEVSHSFKTLTFGDGMVIFARALKELYSIVNAEANKDMWFEQKPLFLSVEVGPGIHDTVIYGRLRVPKIEGFLETRFEVHKGVARFGVGGRILGKSKMEFDRLVEYINNEGKRLSIYRGQAIQYGFPVMGEVEHYTELMPSFLDVTKVPTQVFSSDLGRLIDTALFAPVEHTEQCRKNKIPLKRGILLEGPFGTGKTLTALECAKRCTANGWTFIYLTNVRKLPQALRLAHDYQPCVIFAEDVDQVFKDENDRGDDANEILNAIDGIDSKNAEIITVLTTNQIDGITKAMLRPGRLDTLVPVRPPDAKAAIKLVETFSRGAVNSAADLTEIGTMLAGHIPAVIREVVERSRLSALRRNPDADIVLEAEDLKVAILSMREHQKLLEVEKPDERSDVEKAAATIAEALKPKANGSSVNTARV